MTPPTEARILDAALAVMAARGLGKLTLEDVAQDAGVSRQTVYRYFGNRDALVTAVILREEQTFIVAVTAAAAAHEDFRGAIEAAITTALRVAREHPVLDRLLETEPDALLPFLLSGGAPVLSAARPVFADLLAQRRPRLPPDEVQHIADATTRLLMSYVVSPPDGDPERLARSLAGLLLDGIPDGPSETA